MSRHLIAIFLLCLSLLPVCAAPGAVAPPKPYGPLPSASQLQYQEMEFYGFLHFGMNTFTDKEWGNGDAKPALFNPTRFDADQIVGTLKEAGMKAVVLVCKHHDGFCLWPSAYTDYSVKQSPWRNGHGDVVKEISDSCRKHGLKFGVYLSPWDRNRKDYGSPAYITYYRSQLSELLTNYGDVFMTWHDGAQGRGEGYYGGANEVRKVDRSTYYDWPGTWQMIHMLQPAALIRSDAGPDVRWIGNESATAGDSCWYTIDLTKGYPGMANRQWEANGQRNGPQWIPPECDVSIRSQWFYHRSDDEDGIERVSPRTMTLFHFHIVIT